MVPYWAPAPHYPPPGSATAVALLGRKSAGVAAILSLLFTGAGQMYCGRVGRGIAFFCAAFFCALLMFVLIGFILLPIVLIWALVDAVNLANRHNENLARQILSGPYA
jgi:TM2 domain-containing membrane protein YozV